MKSKLMIIFLTLSLITNLAIGAVWIYSNQKGSLDDCITQTQQLEVQMEASRTDLDKSRNEEKYLLEIMLKSGAEFQKFMPEYADLSKEQFTEKSVKRLLN
jgi:hypothetical protein